MIAQIGSLGAAGLAPAQILTVVRQQFPLVILVQKDVSNILQKVRIQKLGGRTPIQWLLEELESKGFSPAYTTNPDTNALLQLFFIHPRAVELWKQHPDVLLLDCTYKTNRFNMPLLNICAISGNNRVVQVGLAFLSGEKQGDYTWAIQQLRTIMVVHNIEEPVSIVTDRELALINCLESLFPQAIHLLACEYERTS